MLTAMNAAIFSALLALSSSGAPSSGTDLCRCVNHQRTIQVTATLSQADVKGDLDASLAQAERKAALRGAFAATFCGATQKGFERIGAQTIKWNEAGCSARNPSPRVWPELLRITCEDSENWPQLPATFKVSSDPWQSRGEELNRVWEKNVRVSTSCED